MFDRFPEPLPDALHAVMARFRSDPRPHKIDLGVGVYRDDSGVSPIMGAVRQAETELAREGDSKAYQALAGDHQFIDAMTSLIEPMLICFLGVIVGGIVIAMFLPIFKLNDVVSGAK